MRTLPVEEVACPGHGLCGHSGLDGGLHPPNQLLIMNRDCRECWVEEDFRTKEPGSISNVGQDSGGRK